MKYKKINIDIVGKSCTFYSQIHSVSTKKKTILLATIVGIIDNFMTVIWWQGEKLAGWEIGRVRNSCYLIDIGPHDLDIP